MRPRPEIAIGELSRRTQCNIETIRYYERIGLLPQPRRHGGRFRRYGDDDIARLRFIRRARQLGFTLDEVRALLRLSAADGEAVRVEARSIAAAHIEDIRAKIADLQAMEHVLNDAICECDAGKRPRCPLIEVLSDGSLPSEPGIGTRNPLRSQQPIVSSDALPPSLEAGSVIRALAPGEFLFEQGDRATAIYKVESGRLRLIRRTVDDHLVVLHTARRGEFFAEASLFAEVYHCDAIAASQSRVRIYPKAKVMDALRTDPLLTEALMARLAHQLQELRARMELRNVRSARERVLQYLRLRTGSNDRSIAIEGRLQDIAAEIGMTREALYRALARLEAEGSITRTETTIVLKKSDDA